MRLALKVGRLDWRRALKELTPSELIEWFAFERIEPFGQEWHQSSMIAASVINELRGIAKGLGGGKLKEEDLEQLDGFVPGVAARRAEEETKESMKALKGMIGL